MSNYDILLAEAKSTVTGTAKHYIPKLYEILTKEESKPPEEARNIIEHDLALYWTKAIISRHLPDEAKDKNKVKAGKSGKEAQTLVLAEGQSVTTESDNLDAVSPDGNDNEHQNERHPITPVDFKEEDPNEAEIAYWKEKVGELEDALRKTEQFKPATQLQQINLTDPKGLIEKAIMNDEHYFKWLADKADGSHSFYYDSYGIDLFKNRELSQLKNSGVKVFRRLYFEV